MDLKHRYTRRSLGGLVGAALAMLMGLVCETRLGDPLARLSYDLPFRFQPPYSPSELVIVYADDSSQDELGQPGDRAWDRTLHARLIERLTHSGAKVVAYDYLFTGPGPNEVADARLAKAIKDSGRVVLARAVGKAESLGLSADKLEPLAFQDGLAGWGLANIDTDADGMNRRHPVGSETDPSFSWAVARAAGVPLTSNQGERFTPRWFRYYGEPGTLQHVRFAEALATNSISDHTFKDKVVFVGAKPTAGFTRQHLDEFGNPYARWGRHAWQFSPGVEVQATAYLNLARGDWLRRCHWTLETILMLSLGFILGYGLSLFPPLTATFAALGALVVVLTLTLAGWWTARFWFPWAGVVCLQLPTAYCWSLVFNSVRLYIEKKVLERSLVLHLSPYRVKQILEKPELLKPGAEKQEVSILFTDIANFTRLTSRMDSDDLFRLLNNYYQVALSSVHENDGTVVNLIGDAILAIWNAPFTQPNKEERACRAALLLRSRLAQFEAREQSLPLHTRVGLHAGFAHVGNLGSTEHFDYAAVGDSVNLASRLEGLNKHLGTDILATRDIQRSVEKTLLARMVGHFRFKGFDRVSEVYELIGEMDQAEATKPWREAFAQGIYHFQRKAFPAAEAAFRRTLELKPGDGPSAFYLERIAMFTQQPPVGEWAGEIDMKEK